MKIFKFSAMILLLTLVFGSCKKDMDSISPDINKNDTESYVNSRSSKSDLPEFMAKRLLEYDQVTKSLGLQSFKARWGAVKTGTRIYSTNSKNDNLIIFPIEGDLGQRSLLVGAYNEKATGVFVISENAILTEENIKGTPFDVDFQRIFDSSSDGVLAGFVLPDGCYEWTGDCFCFVSVPCDGDGGGGDGSGDGGDGGGSNGDGSGGPGEGNGPGDGNGNGHGYGHGGPGNGSGSGLGSDPGSFNGSGGEGVVHLINYAYKFKAQILSLKSKYNLGPKMTQWLFDHASLFLDDELAADIEDKIATIVELQKELGFDDDVAVYLLQNAPDGADVKALIILALKAILGPEVDIVETDGTNDVLVIDDAKDIIPLTTKISSFDFVEDIKVTSLLNGKLKAEATTSSIVLSNLHTSVVFQPETTTTPFAFVSETTDLVGWHIALEWVETSVDNDTNPYLFSQQNVLVEGRLDEGFKISAMGVQFFIGKSFYVQIIAGIDKKTGKGTMEFKTYEP